MKRLIFLVLILTLRAESYSAEPIIIAEFEGSDYAGWQVTGTAFGVGPAAGTLPGQMQVEGFHGKGLVNSFHGGDNATGRLRSATLKMERKFLTFQIGGGGWAGETCLNLIVAGKIVRTATGPNTAPGGSERLEASAWDVAEFAGREAILEIVDERTGGWGHVNVDHILLTDDRADVTLAAPPVLMAKNVTREIVIQKKLLHFPVKNGAKKRMVTLSLDGAQVRRFEIELADAEVDWWAPLEASDWTGKKLSVTADLLPEGSKALDALRQSDLLLDSENLYREALRPQIHFSAKRGWLNDPNGLAFYNGEYHLFFQHNPYGWGWGNMHWGHATSRDLVHWSEHGDVLRPDDMGPMFSGSAVVDWRNTSGFGKHGSPPLVLIYTAAGDPTTQCLAYSSDGRTITKFAGNPVVRQITGGNRDPKVFWHEPTGRWVMVLYVGLTVADGVQDAKDKPSTKHTIHFFTSPNLRDWSLTSITDGGTDDDHFLFECPDFFQLPVDGDAAKSKWVLSGANSEYAIGNFDGQTFTPESAKLPDVRGRGYYAAQTYSDIPDGRRIQIGWCQAPSPGMPFNQLQSLPSELTLRSTPAGARLFRTPVKELDSLRDGPSQADSLAEFRAEQIELRAEITLGESEPSETEIVEFNLRGARIAYDARNQEIIINELRAPAPLIAGRQRFIVFVDRTMLEVFASDGLSYVPLPFIPKQADQAVTVNAKGDKAKLTSLQVYKLKSIWEPGMR